MKTQYAKKGDDGPYDMNKMRYFGEYSAHMYAYFPVGRLTRWSRNLEYPNVFLYELDGRWGGIIDFAAYLFGFLGF